MIKSTLLGNPMGKYKDNLRIYQNRILSYQTHVATIHPDHIEVLGYWSRTTTKHINYAARELKLPIRT